MEHDWRSPPDVATIRPDEVHVWRFELDRPGDVIDRLRTSLAPDECARADRFRFGQLRDRFVVGRGTLRAILGRYLDIGPERVRFRYGPHGKPYLEGADQGPSIRFNLAHSGGLALLAVTTRREIGVDIEQLRPLRDAGRIIGRFFSAGEIAEFLALSEDLRDGAFFLGWTRKEAFLKATGGGLSARLDSFDVSLTPGEPARLLRVEGRPREAGRWSLYGLDPGPGFAGALAVEGSGHRLLRFRC